MAHAVQARPPARVGAIDAARPGQFPALVGEERLQDHMAVLLREAATRLVGSLDGARILDVACGTRQYVVDQLWGDAELRVGMDLDLDALRRNRQVSPVCADMYALPARDAFFDVVVSLDTVEHSERPERFLAEVQRVLKPGGRALLITPNLLGYTALTGKVVGSRGADLIWRILKGRSLPYEVYYRVNTQRAARRAASRAGLELAGITYVPTLPHFFYGRYVVSRLALLYNYVLERVGLPWLYHTMLILLEKPDRPGGGGAGRSGPAASA